MCAMPLPLVIYIVVGVIESQSILALKYQDVRTGSTADILTHHTNDGSVSLSVPVTVTVNQRAQ